MTKKAAVIIATFAPQRPCRPAMKMATARGESASAMNSKTSPTMSVETARSRSSSTVMNSAAPMTTAITPTAAPTALQKPVDFSESRTPAPAAATALLSDLSGCLTT